MNLFVSVIPREKEAIRKYKRILKKVIPATIPFTHLDHERVIWNNHSVLSASFSIHQSSVAIQKYAATTDNVFCTFNGIPILDEFCTSAEPWSSIMLDKYMNKTLNFESMGGYYNVMMVDHDSVRVYNSLIRAEPVYWTENNDCIVVGNRASLVYALANQSISFEYNLDALISLCTIGWPVHDLVPFKGVNLLPSGTMLEIKPGYIRTHAYKPYEFNEVSYEGDSSKKINQLYDELCEELLSGVKLFNRFSDYITLRLTGGKDSRLAAALCSEAGINFSCITLGGPKERDVIVAAEIADILGVKHKRIDPNSADLVADDVLMEMIKRQVFLGDCCSNIYDPCFPVRLKPDVQFSGNGGACYKGGYDNLKGSRRPLITNHRDARTFLDNLSLHNKGILLTDDAIHQQEKINDEIIDRFFSSSFPNENFYDYMFTLYREGRAVMHNRQASAYAAFQYSPNYNDNALKIAWKIPLRLRQNHEMYYNLLLRLNPELANHRFSDSRWKFEENGPGPNTSYDEWKRREPLPPSPKKHQADSWRYEYDNESIRNLIRTYLFQDKDSQLFQIINSTKLEKLLSKPGPTPLRVIRSVFGTMCVSFSINNDWVHQGKRGLIMKSHGVSEAYYGQINDDSLKRKVRQRIHWICENVQGHKVLDVGCNQGITSILLGREGFEVIGMDIDKEAIAYAIRELQLEEDHVQQNVSFFHQNVISSSFERGSFDTIITSGTIEHVVQPQKLLHKLWELLNEEGRIILTVPFGISDSINQIKTYYLADLLKLTTPYFELNKMVIIGGYICFIGCKRTKKLDNTNLQIDIDLIEQVEAAFYNIERALLDDLKDKKDTVRSLKNQKENLEKAIQIEKQEKNNLAERVEAELTTNLAAEQKGEELKREIANVKLQIKQIEKEKETLIKEKEQLNHELKNIKSAVSHFEKKARKVVSSKDKNIRYLRNRLAVTEQSVKFRLGSALLNSVKNPLTIPKNAYLISSMFAGGIRRKIKGVRRKYKLTPLPYDDASLPSFSQSGHNETPESGEGRLGADDRLNELLLTGLHEPTSLEDLKVAAILDDFSTSCFAPDCKLITFRPDNWKEVLNTEYPHVLFVESAWKGNGGAWQYKIAKYSYSQGPELDELLFWCRHKKIPTVFWNKEDPIHFDKFIHTARKFDIIFTSDANCIEKYKEIVGHERVYALPFAAQPTLHNPTRVKGYKQKKICFAGSYYANRHPQRREDMERLLDGALHKGLEIYDRNYRTESEHFRFPERFQPYIKGSLPYDKLVHAYKQYKVFLNCNSVTDSPTMFSRRVFELLACGTTVVSTYGRGIAEMLGDHVLLVDHDNAETLIDKALTDVEWCRKNEVMGIRAVFKRHTYSHRLHEIARKCGYELAAPYQYRVALIGKPATTDEAEQIIKMFVHQSYPHRQLYLFVNSEIDVQARDERITVIDVGTEDQYDFTEDYIGFLSPDHYYSNHYVEDLMHAVKYSKADIVGKASVFAFDREKETLERRKEDMEYIYTQEIVPEAALFSTVWMKKKDFRLSELTDKSYLQEAAALGARLYAIDSYNFVMNASYSNEIEFEKLMDEVSV